MDTDLELEQENTIDYVADTGTAQIDESPEIALTEEGGSAESQADGQKSQEQHEGDITLAGEEQGSQNNRDQLIPISPKKLAKLREGRREARSEVGELKAELERIKAHQATIQAPAPTQTAVKVPDRYDFKTEEDFNRATNTYFTNLLAENQKQVDVDQNFTRRVNSAMDGHYDRASTLLKEHKLSPEVYEQNEANLRNRIGDGVFEHVVEVVGEGMEKVAFFLGDPKNASKLDKVEDMFRSDPTGLTAVAYMGRLTANLAPSTKKRVSNAPPADSALSGKAGAPLSEKSIISKLDRLRAAKNMDGFRKERRALVSQGHTALLKRNGYIH